MNLQSQDALFPTSSAGTPRTTLMLVLVHFILANDNKIITESVRHSKNLNKQ